MVCKQMNKKVAMEKYYEDAPKNCMALKILLFLSGSEVDLLQNVSTDKKWLCS